ncbi:fumarylacetoacetate hydrolase family protein [Vibrio agarivorans]|uniref:Fumarylacetoacetate hydrolase family protein n=1 Tax=Vibrio agarivorans TaxID=153622 RepID=A0ABT7Y3E8_9VIBR|nr:fumarylacetoacetate hydrolase family protein [Vibrio agarivorans]MDN2482575.1 fumarylacetoacetate hydrolase family protein [Vibrio agarivorans]
MTSIRYGEQLIQPSKILCVGRNYVEHIKELGNPIPDEMVVFSKPCSAITQELRSYHQEPLHYEAEICFMVQNKQLSAVGVGLDLTKRELQAKLKQKGLPWERAKAFDGSAVFSRFISLENIDISELSIELFINCVRVQRGHVSQMLYPPLTILSELQTYTTLQDNDVIMTGTPSGVGVVHEGDVFLARLKQGDKTLIETEWVAR